MNVIKREVRLCHSCMEEHEVWIVIDKERAVFKDVEVIYDAKFEYCPLTDEYTEKEDMINENDIGMKDSYRSSQGLLSSYEIVAIREKYSVSQKDFSRILEWGLATISRYEKHQVQDRAHDDVLRRVSEDPSWFMKKLIDSSGEISEKAFMKYTRKVRNEMIKSQLTSLKTVASPIKWHVEVEIDSSNVDQDALNSFKRVYVQSGSSASYTCKNSEIEYDLATMA